VRNNTACNLSASLAPAIEVFLARCDRRATLCCSCDLDLRTAVDELQEAAVSTGLVAELGQDAVQRMMVEAFAKGPPDTRCATHFPKRL
jgi:hypothetical protein